MELSSNILNLYLGGTQNFCGLQHIHTEVCHDFHDVSSDKYRVSALQ
jgi:hypothetical protein